MGTVPYRWKETCRMRAIRGFRFFFFFLLEIFPRDYLLVNRLLNGKTIEKPYAYNIIRHSTQTVFVIILFAWFFQLFWWLCFTQNTWNAYRFYCTTYDAYCAYTILLSNLKLLRQFSDLLFELHVGKLNITLYYYNVIFVWK